MACDKRSLYAVSGGQDSITAFSTIALQSALKPKIQCVTQASLHCEYRKRCKENATRMGRVLPPQVKSDGKTSSCGPSAWLSRLPSVLQVSNAEEKCKPPWGPNAFTLWPMGKPDRKAKGERHETSKDPFRPKRQRVAAHQAQWLLEGGRSLTLSLGHKLYRYFHLSLGRNVGANTLKSKKKNDKSAMGETFSGCFYYDHSQKIDFFTKSSLRYPIYKNRVANRRHMKGPQLLPSLLTLTTSSCESVLCTTVDRRDFVKSYWVSPKHTSLAKGKLSSMAVHCKGEYTPAMARRMVSFSVADPKATMTKDEMAKPRGRVTLPQKPLGRVRHCPWGSIALLSQGKARVRASDWSRVVKNQRRKAYVGAERNQETQRKKSDRLQWFYQKTHGINRNQPMAVRKVCLSLKQPLYQSVSQNDLRKGDSNEINEDKSRMARYGCFMQISLKHNYATLTVSHTASDKTENVLTNVFKGSNPWFLSGLTRSLIVRPLLWLSRWETKFLCTKYRLPVCVDKSNGINSLLTLHPPSSPHFRSSLVPSPLEQKHNCIPHVRLEGGNHRNCLRYIIIPFIHFTTFYSYGHSPSFGLKPLKGKTKTESDWIHPSSDGSRATKAERPFLQWICNTDEIDAMNSSTFNREGGIEMNAARYATLLSYDCDYYIKVVKSITKLHLYQSYSYVIRFFIKTLLFHEFVNA